MRKLRACGGIVRRRFAARLERPIDRLHELFARAFGRGDALDLVVNRFQRSARHVLHVKQSQFSIGQVPLIVHADDVRVIELRERLRLAAFVGRNLERHHPLHRPLPCKINAGKRAAAQLGKQIEIVDPFAKIGRQLRRSADERRRHVRRFELRCPH